jgi:hypothetical protein
MKIPRFLRGFSTSPAEQRTGAEPSRPGLSFAELEAAFVKRYDVALTSSRALVVRPRDSGSYHTLPPNGPLSLACFLREELTATNQSHHWRATLPEDFASWLTAGSEILPGETLIRGYQQGGAFDKGAR